MGHVATLTSLVWLRCGRAVDVAHEQVRKPVLRVCRWRPLTWLQLDVAHRHGWS